MKLDRKMTNVMTIGNMDGVNAIRASIAILPLPLPLLPLLSGLVSCGKDV